MPLERKRSNIADGGESAAVEMEGRKLQEDRFGPEQGVPQAIPGWIAL